LKSLSKDQESQGEQDQAVVCKENRGKNRNLGNVGGSPAAWPFAMGVRIRFKTEK